jgi:hypothetical protein
MASVAAIQPYRTHANVLEIRYEELCTEPEPTLRRVCAFLDVEYDSRYFNGEAAAPSVLTKARGHSRWGLRPGNEPSARSVGRFCTCDTDWGFLAALRLAPGFAELLRTRQWSVVELAQSYGYEIPDCPREASERAYRPLSFARRLNGVMRWLDRTAGEPGYMPETVFPFVAKTRRERTDLSRRENAKGANGSFLPRKRETSETAKEEGKRAGPCSHP